MHIATRRGVATIILSAAIAVFIGLAVPFLGTVLRTVLGMGG